METTEYYWATGLFIALVVKLFGLIIYALYKSLPKVFPENKKILPLTILGLLAWLALLAILSLNGFFLNFSTIPPRFAIVILPPIITIVILANLKAVTRLLAVIPQQWLIYTQAFRIWMEIILWLVFMAKVIPVQMTFEGRNFDILVGISAPVIAYFCFTKRKWSKKVAIIWNFVGWAILTNIVVIALLSTPTPFRVFTNEPANTLIAYMPYVWLPGFVVPVALALHIFSLKQLFNQSDKK